MSVKPASDNARKVPRIFEHDVQIVGVGFRLKRDARQALASLAAKRPIDGIKLVREQENRYDVNAIKVMHPERGALSGKHLGYLRREAAELLAPLMDEGLLRFKSAELLSLDGSDDHKTGVLHVAFIDKRPAKRA